MKLPPKKRYPDYYVTIKKPIALDTIQGKIDKDEYADMEALKADFTLMTGNAKKYNVKGSSIYEDAVTIQVSLRVCIDISKWSKTFPLKHLNRSKSRFVNQIPQNLALLHLCPQSRHFSRHRRMSSVPSKTSRNPGPNDSIATYSWMHLVRKSILNTMPS
jgi:hypothetical protein